MKNKEDLIVSIIIQFLLVFIAIPFTSYTFLVGLDLILTNVDLGLIKFSITEVRGYFPYLGLSLTIVSFKHLLKMK